MRASNLDSYLKAAAPFGVLVIRIMCSSSLVMTFEVAALTSLLHNEFRHPGTQIQRLKQLDSYMITIQQKKILTPTLDWPSDQSSSSKSSAVFGKNLE